MRSPRDILSKHSFAGLVWGTGSFAVVLIAWTAPAVNAPLRRAETILYDLRLRSRPQPTGGKQVAVVAISKADEQLFGPLSWPRERYARLVDQLAGAGAKAIMFDMYFDRPDARAPENDERFAQAIKRAGMVFLSEFRETKQGFRLGESAARGGRWVRRGHMLRNIPILRNAAAGVGHINVLNDPEDSLVRRIICMVGPVRASKGQPPDPYGDLWPTSLLTALRARGITDKPVIDAHRQIRAGTLSVPLDVYHCIPVNYLNFARDVYPRDEAMPDALHREQMRKPIILYSCRELLNEGANRASPRALQEIKGKVVVVGAAVTGMEQDVHSTPMGRQFGVLVQAALIHSILNGQFIRIPSEATTAVWLAIYSLLLGFLAFNVRVQGSSYTLVAGAVVALLAALAALFWLSVVLYNQRGLMIHVAPFGALLALQITTGLSINLSRSRHETEAKEQEVDLLIRVGDAASGADEATPSPATPTAGAGGDMMAVSLSVSAGSAARRILRSLASAVPCRGSALYTLDAGRDRLALAAVHGFDGAGGPARLQAFADTLNAQLRAAPRPLLIADVAAAAGAPREELGAAAVLAVPIAVRNSVIGALHLYDRLQGGSRVDFSEDDVRLMSAAARQTAVALDNERLYTEMHGIFMDYIRSMAAAIDARDRYTHGHSQRVAQFSVGVAKQMGVSNSDIELIELAATVHDVGKIGVPEHILNKPGKLTSEEFAQIQAHAVKGADIISEMAKLRALVPGVRHHHERYDGSGYPDRLRQDDIPRMARIISVADAFDAMASDRIYRPGMPFDKAITEVENAAGSHFDPQVAEAFLVYCQGLDRHIFASSGG